jgi:acyl-CoA synthetase (AMP-forming)/AMP-acid ligase II
LIPGLERAPQILTEILHSAAEQYPDHGIGYIRPDKNIRFQTYPELLEEAKQVLSGFQQLGIKKGEKVIFSLDTCEEIIPVLWACFLGGIVPALLQPPVSFSGYNPAAEKAGKVFRILHSPWVILSHSHLDSWRSSDIPDDRLIDILEIPRPGTPPSIPEIKSSNLALIQFSSGSTGDPKGIMLNHRNILVNVGDIMNGIDLRPNDITVNWMPLYHDMGLFGFHITAVFVRYTHYLLDPVDFVKNPFLWLDILSETKCTVTACPNFGQIVVNRFMNRKPAKNWDLSGIRVMFNGAEPISIPVMNEFLNTLKPFGLRSESMFPAYGMAEATLAATFPPMMKGADVRSYRRNTLLKEGLAVPALSSGQDVIELVSVGKPLEHCSLKIVNHRGFPVEEGTIGHIFVKGENVSSGYFNNPAETKKVFSDEWLLTGDLGFQERGDLFITGRTKDIIFINGTNYYAHDLETITRQLKEIPPGKIVMSGYFDEEEGRDKVIVFLVGADTEAIRKTFAGIQELFLKDLGLLIDTFIPIRSGDIPRTSSGKIQRYKLVERFLGNEFPVVVKI